MHSSKILRALPALVAGVSFALAAAAAPVNAPATGPTVGEDVRSLNGEALRLQSEARRSKAADVEARAGRALERRNRALRELIERDPAAAAAIALPGKVLQQLGQTFPSQKANLEQRGAWDGEVEYLIEDDAKLKSHREIFKLHRGRETFDLKFAGRAPPRMRSGQKLRVRGVLASRAVAATEVEVLDAFLGGTSATTALQDANAAQCGTTGPQSILTVLVNLPSYKLPGSVTADFMRGVIFGNSASSSTSNPDWSVDDFWQQASDGRTWVDSNSTVVGPIQLNSDFNKSGTGATTCDNYGLRDAVIAAIDGQVDFRNYSRIQIIMPANGACSWAGTANVGCRTMSSPGDGSFYASVAWQRAESMTSRASAVQLSTHELGHNLSLSHAGSRDFGSEALGPVGAAGTLSEYGDPFSTMGSWNFGFYAASHAANQLNWLSGGANYRVVDTSGTYTIQNFENRPAGLKALKVRRGSDTNDWLWIESRQNVGRYSSQLSSYVYGGALIHFEDGTTGNDTHLLDFTPETSTFADGVLAAGRTWSDPYSNLSVTVSSVSSSATTVTVNYGPVVCTPAAPSVSLSPVAVSTDRGAATQLAVIVRNNNSSACPAESFALTAAVPANWTATLGTNTVSLASGQQSAVNLVVAVPEAQVLGTYAVSVTGKGATNALTARGEGNVTVTEPPAPVCSASSPILTVTPSKATVEPGGKATLTIAVRNNNSAACTVESLGIQTIGPAAWSYALGTAILDVASGAEAQTSLTVGVPTGTDPGLNMVVISVKNAAGGANATTTANIEVTKPSATACTRAAPFITMSPNSVSIEQGSAMQLSVTVRNMSSAACPSESFAFAGRVPSGWSGTFGGGAISLSPGQDARITYSVAVPTTANPGAYSVQASASSAASSLASEVMASVSVTAPAPPPCTPGTPTLTVSPANQAVTPGATIQLAVTAGNTNSASCGAEAFGLGASVPAGWTASPASSSLTIATGAQASSTVSVQVPSSQEAGTFQVGLGIAGATSGLKATRVASVTVEVPSPPPAPTPTPTPTPEPTPAPTPPAPAPTPEPTPVPEPTPSPSPSPSPTPSEKPVTAPNAGQSMPLYLQVSKKNRGTVVVSETGQSCSKRCSMMVVVPDSGTVTLSATASGRGVFVGWSGSCSGTQPTCTVTLDAARSVTALFVKRKG
jgi:M6 family metalloprotease-like protein